MAYSISTAFAIYFVLWWIVLFLTLPFGVRSQHEDGEGAPGTDPGAPILARMGWKLVWTTLISAVIFGIVGLLSGLSEYRAAVEADGNAVLGCMDANDATPRGTGISAVGIGRVGFRHGPVRHGGNQLPDGLRCQSGALRERVSSGSTELFGRRNFIVCEIEGFAARQASADDRRTLVLPQYLPVFDLRAST